MGQFSYACKSCGGHDQFDWVTSCVVELALTTGKTIHVEGYYDGYGRVTCRVGEKQQCCVYPDQFAHAFKYWDGKHGGAGPVQITTSKIWCNGSHGCERNCVPSPRRSPRAAGTGRRAPAPGRRRRRRRA